MFYCYSYPVVQDKNSTLQSFVRVNKTAVIYLFISSDLDIFKNKLFCDSLNLFAFKVKKEMTDFLKKVNKR